MERKGKIIWLASYPKSGNTWLRIFLNNLLADQDEPVDINALHQTGHIASSRKLFDESVGVDSADLTREEIDYYLPSVHKLYSDRLQENQIIKTHDAVTKNREGRWLIPPEATYRAIYLIRNPLDVCVSFAHHTGHTDFDKMIARMSDSEMMLASSHKKLQSQLHQYTGSWSDHVHSWTHSPLSEKVLVIRYEDLQSNPEVTFTRIVRFVGLQHDREAVRAAIRKSQIKELQRMEEEKGFRERLPNAERFFRKGVIGSWKEELSSKQANRIIDDHRDIMIEYGYMDDKGLLMV